MAPPVSAHCANARICALTIAPAARMPMPRIYRFADLEVDEGRQRVRRGGTELPLPKLSFDLLLVLLDAAPNFVSHRQLMERVWPGLVVGDKTVTQRVKLLRDALGDDRDEPQYIAGLRGRGYSIKAPVTSMAQSTSDTGEFSATRTGHPGRLQSAGDTLSVRRLLPASAALVVALLAWWLWTDWPKPVPLPATSIAVLPFRDLSGAGTELALGIPEAVLDTLATASDLTVIARASSFRAAEQERSVQELRNLLRARYLVDGSVQRAGNSLRISAQLVDADTGTELWAEHYDVDITDVFGVQDEIAAGIADALNARVGKADSGRAPTPTANIDAYLAFLRGRALLARWTQVDAEAAARAFETAIELDPGFGAAYAALYDARLMAADRGCDHANGAGAMTTDSQCGIAAAKKTQQSLIDRALALDPRSGAAFFVRAIWADDTAATREDDFRRGLALDPSNGRGITAYGEFLARSGRRAEASQMLERAIRVDPLSPRAYFSRVMRNEHADAATLEDGMLGVLEVDPDYVPALQRYAKYRWLLHGELARGIQFIEHALTLDPGSPWLQHTAIAMYLDIGDIEAARALNASAERPQVTGRILLSLYGGDAPAAGAAAIAGLGFVNGRYENWGVYDALRARAVTDGEYAEALDYLQQRLQLGDSGTRIALDNFRAVPAFAQLQMLAGQNDEARALLRRCIGWVDDRHLPKMGGVYALRIKAEALMLLGDTDAAFEALDASFAALDYTQWWYTIHHDPLWLPWHDDPRFVSIAATARRHVQEQRQMLEDFRAQGVVPRRGAGKVASNAL